MNLKKIKFNYQRQNNLHITNTININIINITKITIQ